MALTVRLALAVQALRHLQTSELVVAVAVLVRQAAQAVLAEAAM
jgi:predicted phosphoribosyltransferase